MIEEKLNQLFPDHKILNFFDRTFLAIKEEELVYVFKKVAKETMPGKGFIQTREIPGWELLRPSATTIINGELFETIKPIKEIKESEIRTETINAVIQFYLNSDAIKFISDIPFTGTERFDNLLTERANTFRQTFDSEEVFSFASHFYNYAQEFKSSPENCSVGFVHGDMYARNILTMDHQKFYLIDYDTVRLSYPVIDMAQFFYIHVIKEWAIKKTRSKEDVMSHCANIRFRNIADKENFVYFILLSAFHWELETTPFSAPPDVTRLQFFKDSISNLIAASQEINQLTKDWQMV